MASLDASSIVGRNASSTASCGASPAASRDASPMASRDALPSYGESQCTLCCEPRHVLYLNWPSCSSACFHLCDEGSNRAIDSGMFHVKHLFAHFRRRKGQAVGRGMLVRISGYGVQGAGKRGCRVRAAGGRGRQGVDGHGVGGGGKWGERGVWRVGVHIALTCCAGASHNRPQQPTKSEFHMLCSMFPLIQDVGFHLFPHVTVCRTPHFITAKSARIPIFVLKSGAKWDRMQSVERAKRLWWKGKHVRRRSNREGRASGRGRPRD